MSRFLSALRENWQWKLFSIVAAAMLWMTLVDSPELTTTVNVPLEFKNFPAGLDFGSSIPSEVQLQLRGPKNSVALSQTASTAVILDLGPIRKPGEYTFRVEDGLVGMPPNVQMVTAVPNQIRLILERHLRREVPVRLRTAEFKEYPEYRIVRSELQPESVFISGPESHVQAVDAVYTDLLEFGTINPQQDEPVIEAKLQAFVGDPRVKIESNPAVRARVLLERIRD
jgi:YbbR domain-containing protein